MGYSVLLLLSQCQPVCLRSRLSLYRFICGDCFVGLGEKISLDGEVVIVGEEEWCAAAAARQ